MKALKHFIPLLIAIVISSAVLSGCTDITRSSKYNTYKLTYLINTTNLDGDPSVKLEDLKSNILTRLNKFEVANISADLSKENNSDYIKLKFGTIDDINKIKTGLEQNNLLTMRLQFEDKSDYETDLTKQAEETLTKLKDGADFETTAQNVVLNDPERAVYIHSDFMYKDEIKDSFANQLFDMQPGDISNELIKYTEQTSPLAPPINIVSIVKLFDKKDNKRITKHNKEVEVSHILIAYTGAMRAPDSVTRSQEEAKTLAEEITKKLNNGENFATLAKQYSDDSSNSKDGGILTTPAGKGTYVEQFENAALALEKEGELSPATKTPFGYHIIKANKVTPASEDAVTEPQVKFGILFYALVPSKWAKIEFNSSSLESVETKYDESYDPYLILHLTSEGKTALQEITTKNRNKIIGIFVGNKLITSFTAKKTNSTGTLKILKPANTKEADDLKDLFLTKPLPLPIILQDSEQV